MGTISYVITSTARSGTRYIATLLDAIGLHCTHEHYFTPHRHDVTDCPNAVFGEASWLIAPFITQLPMTTIIFHQIRDPIKTMNSLLYTKHLDLIDHSANPSVSFLERYTAFPDITWPAEHLADYHWFSWHTLIEHNSIGRPYFRYNIETLTPPMLASLLASGLHTTIDSALLNRVFTHVSSKLNTRGRPPSLVNKRHLSLQTRQLAARYGYDY